MEFIMKKEKIKKTITRIIAGFALAALVIVNVQVGLTDGNSWDMSLGEISLSVFTPAIVATVGGGGGYWSQADRYDRYPCAGPADDCYVLPPIIITP